jgi:hypothetical protein
MINEKLANEARQEILDFIQQLLDILDKIIHEPYGENGERLVLEEMRKELQEAWMEFSEDFNLDQVKARIYEAPQELLQTHGLYGGQLRAKLSLFRRRLERFFLGRGTKTLLRLIDAADTVLDSIIAATGLDEAIKEIKDLLRNSIDDE